MHFDALHMLGVIAIQTGQIPEAVSLIKTAISQNPKIAAAHRNHALALRQSDRKQDAVAAYTYAIGLDPQHAATYVHLAELLVEIGRSEDALAWCDKGVQYHAGDPFLHLARALALRGCQRLDEALACCDRAIELRPSCVEAWDKRGAALQELGRVEEALASYAEAIEVRPDFVGPLHHASLVHLQLGDFNIGWERHEYRAQARRDFGRPRWHPSTFIHGESVLLHSEQGLGDTIQFSRYARLVADLGAHVILMVQQPLLRIMPSLGPSIAVIGDTAEPPPSSRQCPLMSLPFAFGTKLDNIPAKSPYLAANHQRIIEWRTRLGPKGFKVGICWHGSGLPAAVGRAFPIEALASIAQLPNVRLISLQKGRGVEQLRKLPHNMKVEELGSAFDFGESGFLDSAAVMECLDLIITCDTSIAHLAGALGRPTWIALKRIADWRWLTDRDDSPWYPSVRLFRQAKTGDWRGVFARMHSDLRLRAPGSNH